MTKEQAQKVLDEMQGVRPELLDNEAKKLFEAIMKIADERDDLKKELKKKDDKIEKYINILATNDMLHVKECEEKDEKIEKLEEIKDEAIRTCFYEYNDDTEILCRKLAKHGYIKAKERNIYKSV